MQNLHTYTTEELRVLRECIGEELRERENKEFKILVNKFIDIFHELKELKACFHFKGYDFFSEEIEASMIKRTE